MARSLALFLAILVLIPSAHAAERLIPVIDTTGPIYSTGNGFAWTTREGHLRVTDVFGRTVHDLPLGPEYCILVGATDAGVALISCYEGWDIHESLLDASTGVRTPIAVRGESFAIGRSWIEGGDHLQGCVRCDARLYTNWHTGEERFGGGRGDTARRDLDDPDLRFVPRSPFRLRRFRERNVAILFRRAGRGWERVARCRSFCRLPQADGDRVTFVDSGREQLVERDVRTGRTRRWQLPLDGGWLALSIHRVGDALLVARKLGRFPDQTWRVWRAPRR